MNNTADSSIFKKILLRSPPLHLAHAIVTHPDTPIAIGTGPNAPTK